MKYNIGDFVRLREGYLDDIDEQNREHLKLVVNQKLTVSDYDGDDLTYLCNTPRGRLWFKEENLVPYIEPFASEFGASQKGTIAPLWNATEAVHDFIALMDKYGVTDYSVEKVNGVLTCKFSRETVL